MVDRRHLPNSPLSEVACEVRFHGNLSLFAAWGRFQTALRPQFPKLYVPAVAPGTAPFLQHVKLAGADDIETVMLAINSFAFSTRRYDTFAAFRARLMDIFSAFCSEIDVGDATRFGLRYINVLPPFDIDGSDGAVIHPCLRLRVGGLPPPLAGGWVSQGQLIFEKMAGKGLSLRASLLRPQLPEGLAIPEALATGVGFDLDCYRQNPGPATQLLDFADEAHSVIDDAFFGMITDKYERYLEGGVDS